MTMYISTDVQHAKVLELLNELVLYTIPDGMKILATALTLLRSLEPQEPVAIVDCADISDYTQEWFAELLPNAHQTADLKVGTALYALPKEQHHD